MNPLIVAGLPASVAVALVVTIALPHIDPRVGSLTITFSMIGIALSSLWLVAVPAVTYLLPASANGTFIEWCQLWSPLSDVPAAVGVPALIVLVLQSVRTMRRYRALRIETKSLSHGAPLTILRSEKAVAVTTPGASGRIIVSTAMLRLLTGPEQRAMLAHERAHLECRHDRFLVFAELAVVALPPLAPLQRLLRRSLERWADERAAAETGDRLALARAIGIAALATAPVNPLASAIAASDVALRVAALDNEAIPKATGISTAVAATLLTASASVAFAGLAGVGFQFHHLAELIVHVCPF